MLLIVALSTDLSLTVLFYRLPSMLIGCDLFE